MAQHAQFAVTGKPAARQLWPGIYGVFQVKVGQSLAVVGGGR